MEPIAVVGLSFKLPQGAEDESSFWEMLMEGRNVMEEWPASRANLDSFYSSNHGKDHVLRSRGGHFLKGDPAAFDAPFFSITSKEAASMDPQQRWLLEACYRALENAGIPVESVAGTDTGVFAASMSDDYMRILVKDPEEAPTNITTGTAQSILANRLSWYFDLRGPSIQLNTACSSSLVALDLGCKSLRSGESSMVLVAASNAILGVECSLYLSSMNFLSPDSRCYSFDHRANGYGRGEGVVVLALKRLSDAVRNGDVVRAVFRASGCNQDGLTPGITQPNLISQEELIRKVYSRCGLGFESTRYVEAHGTGTQIGDSTEANALNRVFRGSRSSKDPLYVGSVKANIGHLEGASGLAGVLKSILILEKGMIPPNALFEKLNPKINSRRMVIQVPTSCIPWPSEGLRRISLSCFGFGGTNCHVIMDDAYHTLEAIKLKGYHLTRQLSTTPEVMTNDTVAGRTSSGDPLQQFPITSHTQIDDSISSRSSTMACAESGLLEQTSPSSQISGSQGSGSPNDELLSDGSANDTPPSNVQSSADSQRSPLKYRLLVWSARNESGLKRMLRDYDEYHQAQTTGINEHLDQLAYTLAARRSLMEWRSFAVVGPGQTGKFGGPSLSNCTRFTKSPGLAFIFTGQGAQYCGMGLQLSRFPVFQSTLEKASRIFCDLGADWQLCDELSSGERINQPQISQPACTALQIALVELLRSFNISPTAVLGHSSGEIAAAYTVGALSLDSACRVAFHRGRLVGDLLAARPDSGAMMSVNLSQSDADAYLATCGFDLHVACVNSASNVTLAGDEVTIDLLKERLDLDGIFAQKLNTGVAYHTEALRPIASKYLSCLTGLERWEPGYNAVMISSVTGERPSLRRLSSAQYWVDNLVSPVLFNDALHHLMEVAPKIHGFQPISNYVEVGPHGALRRPVSDALGHSAGSSRPQYMSLLYRFDSSLKTTLEVAGRLFTCGHPVSVLAVNQQEKDAPQPLVHAPGYPFDHSQIYWHESRLSRQWRLREAVPEGLLGTPAIDWNPLEPRWRRMLSIDEIPWIGDHLVGGVAFFPAAGTLVMAMEAVKTSAQDHRPVSGYQIEEATFMNPIVVRSGEKTEVMTHLRPLQTVYEKTASRFDINIFTLLDGSWRKCFQAITRIEYEDDESDEVDGGRQDRAFAQALASDHQQAERMSTIHISKESFYKWHDEQRIKYGEAFALAKDVYWDGGERGVARVKVPTEVFPGLVHPAVLDASCQVIFLAPSHGMAKTLSTIIPYKMHNAWISASGWQHPQTREIQVATKSKLKATVSGIEGSITALADDGSLLFHVERFDLRPVMGQKSVEEENRKPLHGIDWRPHLSLLFPEQLRDYCDVDSVLKDEAATVEYNTQLEDALRSVLQHNISQLREIDWSTAPLYKQKYIAWVETQLLQKPGKTKDQITKADLDTELERLKVQRPSWRMFIEIGQKFLAIMRGDIDVLDLIFTTPLAQDFYGDLFTVINNHKLVSFLRLSAHQTPNQKILEVGAGSGDMTSPLFSIFQEIEEQNAGTAFSEYVYTDISDSCFEKARERFAEQKHRMTFKPFDLEQDITLQNLEPETFDLVFAGSILHATKNLVSTLRNIRRVLKPGGHLIFHETTTRNPFLMSFAGGTLPGWWSSEEEWRSLGPTITETEWDRVLRESGFSGSDMVIRDYRDDKAHMGSVIIASANKPPSGFDEKARTVFVVRDQDEYQANVATALSKELSNGQGQRTDVVSVSQWSSANLTPADYVVFLGDIAHSLLSECSATTFKSIRHWVQQANNLLWVSSDASYDPITTLPPHSGLKDGLLRTLRAEFTNKRIVALTLEDEAPSSDISSHTAHISRVFKSAFGDLHPEVEYISRGGLVYSGRLVEETSINRYLNSSTTSQIKTEPWLPGPPLKLDIASRGSLDTLRFVDDLSCEEDLGPMEVEIEARAWAVNFRDMFNALGRMDDPGFGSDCAGIVTRVGSGCTRVQPGDRVTMLKYDCMRTYPRTDEIFVTKCPDSVSFEDACAVMTPGITAVLSFITLARLQKGEKVLIHSASGATGQLAVQICQLLGAEVFATVGYDYKKQFLIDTYGIPEDHIFYSRNTSFAKGIKRMTDNRGVDVVLNSLTGNSLRASWDCLAPFGRFVEIGKADINSNTGLPMAQFAQNTSFFAIDLNQILRERPDVKKRILDHTMQLFGDGKIRSPAPLHVFKVSDTEEAFRCIQHGRNMGRVIISIDRSVVVQKHLLRRESWAFDQNATYLVAGGLGGVGRSVVEWMATKGARHLIIPSRSGISTPESAKLVDELSHQGISVMTPRCDVSSKEMLSSILAEYAAQMPPIRGCINATMVLNDAIFDNMTHTQWDQTIRSKLQTSWNLHALLPKNLDFFILLSSISGIIGNGGQSNYAAGCTFQDSLARYRTRHGYNATSIDMGVMRTIGIVAETKALHKKFDGLTSFPQIEKEEIFKLLELCCNPQQRLLGPGRSNIVMGAATPIDLQNQGLNPAEFMRRPLFSHFSQARNISGAPGPQSGINVAALFRQSDSGAERARIVVESLGTKLARALSIEPEDVDVEKPLHAFGVDSLVAVELRNWIAKEFVSDVPVFEIMGAKTVKALGELVTKASQVP